MEVLLEYLGTEQWGLIIAGIVAIFGAMSAAIVFLVRWGVRYFARVQDEKLNAMRQEREIEKADFEARIKQRDREWELRLDETQSGRETQRLFFSEISEQRRIDIAQRETMQAAFDKRDAQFGNALKEMVTASQGLQANTAATLEFLKLHAESDDIMRIKQEKIIAQNDNLQSKLIDVSSSLDAVIIKVDSLASNRVSDKKILDEIHAALVVIQSGVKRLEESQVIELEKPNNNGVAIEVTEAQKEFKKEENPNK